MLIRRIADWARPRNTQNRVEESCVAKQELPHTAIDDWRQCPYKHHQTQKHSFQPSTAVERSKRFPKSRRSLLRATCPPPGYSPKPRERNRLTCRRDRWRILRAMI